MPPHRMESVRDVLLHLAIVTVVILIALGLEQSVEWLHHREVVTEARETLQNEIRFNKKERDAQIAALPGFRTKAIEVLGFVGDKLERGNSDPQPSLGGPRSRPSAHGP